MALIDTSISIQGSEWSSISPAMSDSSYHAIYSENEEATFRVYQTNWYSWFMLPTVSQSLKFTIMLDVNLLERKWQVGASKTVFVTFHWTHNFTQLLNVSLQCGINFAAGQNFVFHNDAKEPAKRNVLTTFVKTMYVCGSILHINPLYLFKYKKCIQLQCLFKKHAR